MNEDDWIVVPHWKRYQTYKAKHPGWIKVYTELNSRDDWLSLTWGQRGVLITTWLEYARTAQLLRSKTLRQYGHRATNRHLLRDIAALSHAGFIDLMGSLEVEKKDKEERNADGLIHIREIQERLNRQ